PELYDAREDYVESLAAFVRGRPMPPVDAFMRQSAAVIGHDASAQLAEIVAPAPITFGRVGMGTATRLAGPPQHGIGASEVAVFEGCAHAPIYEKVDEFNERTLAFLGKHPL